MYDATDMARVTTLKGSVVLPKKLSLEAYQRRQKIGAEIRRLREVRRLSIEEAAARADVSYFTWSRWESGKTAIPLEMVAEIAKALDNANVVASIKPFLAA